MSLTKRTYCKALLLLIVFSLNTVVSFACSMGGYLHSLHHSSPSVRLESGSHHDPLANVHHHSHSSEADDKESDKKGDDCCSDKVAELDNSDKAISRVIDAPKSIFSGTILTISLIINSFIPESDNHSQSSMIRWRLHPTIPDIRIAIQSFQI